MDEGRALDSVVYANDVKVVVVHESLKPAMQCARESARSNGYYGI